MAVSVTSLPAVKPAEQVEPQEIPLGELVTLPPVAAVTWTVALAVKVGVQVFDWPADPGIVTETVASVLVIPPHDQDVKV
jgi:hypothetical protein